MLYDNLSLAQALAFFLVPLLQFSLSPGGGDYRCALLLTNKPPCHNNSHWLGIFTIRHALRLKTTVNYGYKLKYLEGSSPSALHPFGKTIEIASPLRPMTSSSIGLAYSTRLELSLLGHALEPIRRLLVLLTAEPCGHFLIARWYFSIWFP